MFSCAIKNLREWIKELRNRRIGCFGVVLIILLILTIPGIILFIDSNTRLVTTEYKLNYSNLPEAFDRYRIVVLADVHGAQHGDNNENLIDAVKDANPDMIAIVGDLIDRYQPGKTVEKQLEIARKLVEGLMDVAPVYFVTGNHEWDSGEVRSLLTLLEESGVTVLQNQYKLLERAAASGEDLEDAENAGGVENAESGTFILVGVDDPNGPADMVKPDELIENIRQKENPGFIMVLSHRNYNLKMYDRLEADLVLSGHAHGGMVRLPLTDGLIGPQSDFFPTYTSGVYSSGETNMVVSRGIGNHLGWTRFLNNPEVVVVELRVER